MKKIALAASFLALATFASAQQSKPNFSGTWVVISPAQSAGQEEDIRHTDDEIAFGHPSEGGSHHFVYKLDGSETRSTMPDHDGEMVTVAKARWEGERLVIQGATTYRDGRKLEMKQTLSLQPDGQLRREMTATMDGQALPAMTVVARKK